MSFLRRAGFAETQRRNYSRYYSVYARGGTPFQLTDKTIAAL